MNSISNNGTISYRETLSKISQKHHIQPNERRFLKELKKANIRCLSFTTDGGFCEKGNFYKNLEVGLGTIRINYQDKDTAKERILILNKLEKENEEIPVEFKINALYQKIEDAFCFYSQALDESNRLYFKTLFKKLCFHKKAYISGLKSQYKLANYRRKQKGIKCKELSSKGRVFVIKRGLELQSELESLYRDVIPNIADLHDRHTLESHLKYVMEDKRVFSRLKSANFLR
ncbi:hypothetical protein [Zunongwangia pacifica]|uniref:Uncharacterized protein n=1 Tax=Zunongwangia pacifica TaxID=2911062 RepID=A0A9X1ZVK8_9FLAO|nr:hypothetical protein [Zunongwangia pacifica]MCL6217196.1 hypothetical protein [Zunongwangia pacifica]